MDTEGNAALHYACHSAKYDTITLLLDKYGADRYRYQRNAQKQLPIDLLWGSDEVLDIDRGSVDYVESVFRLLRAYPETVMIHVVNN